MLLRVVLTVGIFVNEYTQITRWFFGPLRGSMSRFNVVFSSFRAMPCAEIALVFCSFGDMYKI